VDALISAARAASGDETGTIDVDVTAAYAFDVLEGQLELGLVAGFATGVAGGGGDEMGVAE